MRIKYIDVLKAIAIIAVALYHTGLMEYGYLGVDLFLVIAGYLTTRSLYSKIALSGGGRFYLNFEISRVIRLLPPLLVAGAFCMALGFFVMLPDDYENLSQSVIATNFFGNNILAAITTKDYWNIVNEYKPLMHTWYVGVVMQFYLVYPVLFIFAKRDKKNPSKFLLTLIATLAVVSMLFYFATEDIAQRFYYLPSRFFEFAVGGIVAFIYKPQENKPFEKGFVYGCYFFLLSLLFINVALFPAAIRLVVVVGLTCVLISSQDVLENKFTGNVVIARIGAASYSIFIWHQIVLAFYRYTVTNKFTLSSYVIISVCTILLSWMSYRFIEQRVANSLKNKGGKIIIYTSTIVLFVLLSVFSSFIYMNAGVTRDVPELNITTQNRHRNMHSEYCDRVYEYNRPFKTQDKPHWFVIGNSYGRDFVNIILESNVADSVEISYSDNFERSYIQDRIASSDLVFISVLGLTEDLVTDIEIIGLANELPSDRIIVVGEKDFGESNGQIYVKRNNEEYFDQYIEVKDYERFIVKNKLYADLYGDRYLDLMSIVANKDGKVRVFTPNHHFISADTKHLTKDGALFFANSIDWGRFFK